MKYMLISNKPAIAAYAWQCGVKRLFVDLEINGKAQRQGHLNTVISRHTLDDVAHIRRAAPESELLVRINPIDRDSQGEVERVLALGADIVMLPMFRSAGDVEALCKWVGGRAKVIPLVETVDGMNALPHVVDISGVSEIYIGLNDLHLEMGHRFMFEPLARGYVDQMAEIIRSASLPFGFGGIARVGEGALPAEMILGEHVRLGSTAVILSRTFHRQATTLEELNDNMDFAYEIQRLNQALQSFQHYSRAELDANHERLKRVVSEIVARLQAN